MFAAALIVFRESLEAALFVGIVAAATRQLAGRVRWLAAGVGVGVLGAMALALMARQVATWFDGIGQDAVTIAILSVALTMLLWHCTWVTTHSRDMAADARQLGLSVQNGGRQPWALFGAVALAVLREGAETVLFVGGSLTAAHANAGSVVLSCSVGLALGALVGTLIYAGLSRIPARSLFSATNILIALLAGSIASQLARALAQAGIIDLWSTPVWNSSHWLEPNSVVGTFLHALVGYDPQPSGLQLASYLAVLVFIYAVTRWLRRAAAVPAAVRG
jgi:high-affinity iron transporter